MTVEIVPTVKMKHIIGLCNLKIMSVSFFTIRPMNRYLNLSAVLKFAKTQNEPKRGKTK